MSPHIAYRQVALADQATWSAYQAELVRRYEADLPVGKCGSREARRLIRERAATFSR